MLFSRTSAAYCSMKLIPCLRHPSVGLALRLAEDDNPTRLGDHNKVKCVLLTGIAGFIGSRLGHFLLQNGVTVIGVDNLNDYYDPSLKQHRLDWLKKDFDF